MNVRIRSALAATVLIVPVVAQLVFEGLGDHAGGHALFAVSQLAGWALAASVCRDLARDSVVDRGARLGSRLVRGACVTQAAFAVVYGALALGNGDPEPAFVIYLLGFLMLTVGGVIWGRSLRRDPRLRTAGNGLIGVAALGFLAMAVGIDPFHDIFLLGSFAAWVVVGVGASAVRPAAHSGNRLKAGLRA